MPSDSVTSALRRGLSQLSGDEEDQVRLLAAALDEAQNAHSAWEREHGRDPDWPTWYARYLLGLRV